MQPVNDRAKMPALGVKYSGLTLIEFIVAIVVSSIIAIGTVSFIGDSAEGYQSSSNRNQLASAGRVAISRLMMELHNALPNSIRVTAAVGGDQCIEMVPVRSSTTYVNPPFRGTGGTSFDVIDFNPTQQGTAEGYAVIYPRLPSDLYDGNNGAPAGWPNFPSVGPIEAIDPLVGIVASTSADQSTITLSKNHRYDRRSPSERFFLVEDPVSFCIKGDKLYRYTNYGFFDTQTSVEELAGVCEVAAGDRCLPNYSSAPDKMLITDNIDNATDAITAFEITSQSLTRNSLVSITLNFSRDGDDVRMDHEVMSRSVP